MGYTTDFEGQFNFDKPLDDDTYNLLEGISSTRRMKRKGLDPKYGVDGEFYYNPESNAFGQEDDASVVNHNTPPRTQPGLWCQWVPTPDRLHLEWDYNEKFQEYIKWLEYLIEKIIAPRGYVLNGEVEWQGEDSRDIGKIVVKDNVVSTREGKVIFN